jgi:hypothetical protein
MTMHWSKSLAAATMAVALAAGAQTTVRSSSTASTFTTTATGGGQSGTTPIVKDDLFNGTEIFAKGATDVTEVTMDPDTLGMVGGRNKARANSMVLNVVRTYEYDKPGMYRIEDVDAFRNKLNTGEWHCSVHTRSLKTGESTDVCNKRRSDDLTETAIITVEPKSLTFIHTIRKKYAGESGVEGLTISPGVFGYGIDPASRAEMAINMAELKAQMAEMRALRPDTLSMVGNLNLPDLKFSVGSSLKGLLDDGVRFKVDGEVQKQIDGAMKARDKAEELRKRTQPETSSPKQPE